MSKFETADIDLAYYHSILTNHIDKKLVHKKNDANVLISNLRRSLPEMINCSTIPLLLNDPYFKKLYCRDRNKPGKKIFLYRLQQTELHRNLASSSVFKELRPFLQSTANDPEYLCFKENIDMKTRIQAMEALDKLGMYPDESSRVKLSEYFEEQLGIARKEQFYAHLKVNPKHAFFFEHGNDHIPGMMLIEAIRQMGTACWHLYGKVPLKGSHFILSGIQVSFFNYINIHHPIRLCGVFNDIVYSKEGVWLSYNFACAVYQNGELCATSQMPGKMIHSRLYSRIRNKSLSPSSTQRFHPVISGHIHLSLKAPGSEDFISVELKDLSYQGFRADLGIQEPNHTESNWEFCITTDEQWEVRGLCNHLWKQKEGPGTGFRIISMDPGSEEALLNIIMRFCLIIPARGEGLRINNKINDSGTLEQ